MERGDHRREQAVVGAHGHSLPRRPAGNAAPVSGVSVSPGADRRSSASGTRNPGGCGEPAHRRFNASVNRRGTAGSSPSSHRVTTTSSPRGRSSRQTKRAGRRARRRATLGRRARRRLAGHGAGRPGLADARRDLRPRVERAAHALAVALDRMVGDGDSGAIAEDRRRGGARGAAAAISASVWAPAYGRQRARRPGRRRARAPARRRAAARASVGRSPRCRTARAARRRARRSRPRGSR